ncbi:MAG: HesA/MoeB/ThiF family protein, partial [Gemmobacter sp.]
LLGHDPTPLGQVLKLDLATWRQSGFRFDAAPEPEALCPAIIGRDEVQPGDLVIDLRTKAEAPCPAHPRACRLSPDQAARLMPGPAPRVVFACTTGLRAWRAARELTARTGKPTAVLAS